MVTLPRVVVGAPSTGQGKTTVATGLMAALRSSGLGVSGHKVGPDYIDPGYHALATGRPGRNLDPHLVGEGRVVPLLLHGAAQVDVAIVEGVMGLHDGRLGTDGFASTAHVAALTSSPVVLVIDVARLSRSAGAIAAGLATFDQRVRVGGVILNRAGSAANVREIERAMERAGLPVLGRLPPLEGLAGPSPHLGLVPAQEEGGEAARTVERLGEQLARHLDLTGVLDVARTAPDLPSRPWDPATEVTAASADRPVVAVAGGRAFTSRYAETDELLRAAGCDLVTFDPLADTALPPGVRGIYLGGRFPLYPDALSANRSLLRELHAAVSDRVPTVAECGGMLYLARNLDGVPMAGVLPADATTSDRSTLRYPVARARTASLLTRAGEEVTGHEFHRSVLTPQAGARPAWVVDGRATGFATDSLHASYLHTHWAGHPFLAQRFADAAHGRSPRPAVAADPRR